MIKIQENGALCKWTRPVDGEEIVTGHRDQSDVLGFGLEDGVVDVLRLLLSPQLLQHVPKLDLLTIEISRQEEAGIEFIIFRCLQLNLRQKELLCFN